MIENLTNIKLEFMKINFNILSKILVIIATVHLCANY